jgi:DNA processing protein
MTDERKAWLALSLSRGIGAERFRALVERFGSASAVMRAKASDLVGPGISLPAAARLVKERDAAHARAEAEARAVVARGARLIFSRDADYPKTLWDLPDPPPVLWCAGTLPGATDKTVGIVGTRAPDGYGVAQAMRLAAQAATANAWVVSGGARGIDGAAHEAALVAKGRTLVIAGCGLDVPYPVEHRALFDRITCEGGGLLCELPLGSPPTRGTFPRRNRIIAALSQAIVVVQAGARSGALVTAREAKRLRRPVLAVPGGVDRSPSVGTHRLLREGALLCEGYVDVEHAIALEGMPHGVSRSSPAIELPAPGTPLAAVLDVVGDGPSTFDEITERSGKSAQEIADSLLTLELWGCILLERGYYKRAAAGSFATSAARNP